MSWWLPLAVGCGVGILSAMGLGGGTLLLLYLTTVVGLDQHMAQGTNLLFYLTMAATALPRHWKQGNIQTKGLCPAILAGWVATALGVWGASQLEGHILRTCFGVLLLYLGGRELYQGHRD